MTLLKHTFYSHKIQLLFYTLGIKIAWTSQNFIGNIFTNPWMVSSQHIINY